MFKASGYFSVTLPPYPKVTNCGDASVAAVHGEAMRSFLRGHIRGFFLNQKLGDPSSLKGLKTLGDEVSKQDVFLYNKLFHIETANPVFVVVAYSEVQRAPITSPAS